MGIRSSRVARPTASAIIDAVDHVHIREGFVRFASRGAEAKRLVAAFPLVGLADAECTSHQRAVKLGGDFAVALLKSLDEWSRLAQAFKREGKCVKICAKGIAFGCR